jgi:hypothetical protein
MHFAPEIEGYGPQRLNDNSTLDLLHKFLKLAKA